LLLSNSFTNGHILRILGRNQFYLRKAGVIEDISRVTHIVFDKTGTLTDPGEQKITYDGTPLSATRKAQVAALASCSGHPLSKAIAKHLGVPGDMVVQGFAEKPGQGTEGFVNDVWVSIGAQTTDFPLPESTGTVVYLNIENKTVGCFRFSNHYRSFVPALLRILQRYYPLSVVSGDNAAEEDRLRK